jgi:hypothetical protein
MLTARLLTISLISAAPAALLAQTDPVLPRFDTAVFATPAVNGWFPLTPGLVRTYVGTPTDIATAEVADGADAADEGDDDEETDDDADEEDDTAAALPTELGITTVLGNGPIIMGVQTITILDEDFAEGLIAERTFDYYAADAEGNIWYFGEEVLNYVYDADGLMTGTNTDGTWIAGVDGALPGIAVAAVPTVGMRMFQEYAEVNEALDFFEVIATDLTVTGPAGTFTGVVQTFEGSTLDASAREYKYWAPGLGLIRAEEGLTADDQPEMIVEIQP